MPKQAAGEEQVFEAAVGAGADDVEEAEEQWLVTTPKTSLEEVREALSGQALEVKEASLVKLPKDKKTVEGRDAEVLMNLVEALEDHDDVQQVFSDFELSEDELQRLAQS